MKEKKKSGRPTDSIKNHDIKVRVDECTFQQIKKYSENNKLNIAETIRKAIHKLLDE